MMVFFDELFRQAASTNPSILNKDYSTTDENDRFISSSNDSKDNLGLDKQITDIVSV